MVIEEAFEFESEYLDRTVVLQCFMPVGYRDAQGLEMLLINDGQNMAELKLQEILSGLQDSIKPLFCVAINAGDRFLEYGTASQADYLGRGSNAGAYTQFVLTELLPFIFERYHLDPAIPKSFAGFSLGALSALDIVWSHAYSFSRAGIFSASLWWRSKSLDDGYNEETDRIMHALIRSGKYSPHLKFFFEAGALDETMDRNNNGIIDSIDDTLSLIDELVQKGYHRNSDIFYLELTAGRHDIATWAEAMVVFLRWGWESGYEV